MEEGRERRKEVGGGCQEELSALRSPDEMAVLGGSATRCSEKEGWTR